MLNELVSQTNKFCCMFQLVRKLLEMRRPGRDGWMDEGWMDGWMDGWMKDG